MSRAHHSFRRLNFGTSPLALRESLFSRELQLTKSFQSCEEHKITALSQRLAKHALQQGIAVLSSHLRLVRRPRLALQHASNVYLLGILSPHLGGLDL